MGYYIASSVGFGLRIPEDRIESDPYEQMEELLKDSTLLSFDIAIFYDDYRGAAIYVNRLSEADGGCVPIVLGSHLDLELTADEEIELQAVAIKFGIEYDPVVIAITSYS